MPKQWWRREEGGKGITQGSVFRVLPVLPRHHGCMGFLPCRCMTSKNLTMTFELGRIMTWRLPAFSALLMLFKASLSTLVRTMMTVFWVRFSNREKR